MFLWCHVRHINPSKEHPERIRKIDKKLVKHITNPKETTEGWFLQFMFQIKNLKTLWICCF